MRLAFIIFIGLAFVGCSNFESNKEDKLTNDSIIEIANDIPPIPHHKDGQRYAYVKGIIKYEESYYIKVDFVDYLTGDDASKVAMNENAYFIDGADTILDITNGYYISNPSSSISNVLLDDCKAMSFIIDDDGKHQLDSPKEITEDLLVEYVENQTLLVLKFYVGSLSEAGEQFVP